MNAACLSPSPPLVGAMHMHARAAHRGVCTHICSYSVTRALPLPRSPSSRGPLPAVPACPWVHQPLSRRPHPRHYAGRCGLPSRWLRAQWTHGQAGRRPLPRFAAPRTPAAHPRPGHLQGCGDAARRHGLPKLRRATSALRDRARPLAFMLARKRGPRIAERIGSYTPAPTLQIFSRRYEEKNIRRILLVLENEGLRSSKGQPQLVILSAVSGRRGFASVGCGCAWLMFWADGEVAAGMVGARWKHAMELAEGSRGRRSHPGDLNYMKPCRIESAVFSSSRHPSRVHHYDGKAPGAPSTRSGVGHSRWSGG
jgi:hypothetical protein